MNRSPATKDFNHLAGNLHGIRYSLGTKSFDQNVLKKKALNLMRAVPLSQGGVR